MSHIIDSQRLQGIEESSTLTLNALAKKMKSEGKDVINLTAGEPDFPTPSNIIRAAQEALGRGETRYLPTAGLPQLREAVAKLSSADYRYPFQANHVLISNGVKQALFSLLQSLINPGDEVIFPAPYWLSYPPMVKLAGGTPIVWQLQAKNNFLMQPETIRPLLTARTKAIIINSPSNPSGAVQDRLRLEKLIEELKGRNIYLIFDDIYDKITFAPHQWVSPFSLKGIDPDYLMSVNGVSKSYAMTGFRIGWVLASAARVARLSSWQSHATSSPSTVSQWAALEAVSNGAAEVEKMRQAFALRRELVLEELRKIPQLFCPEIGGAFYAFPDFSAYLGKNGGNRWSDSQKLAETLLHESLLAMVPGNDFGAPMHMRISFAASEATLRNGLMRLAAKLTNRK